jgi:hypothetical protein
MDLDASGAACFRHTHAAQDSFVLGFIVGEVCESHT